MSDREKNVGFAALLNILFTIIELIGGFLTNSLALLADSLHDFADSLVLIVAWFSEKQAKKPATNRMTFGYRRLSLLSAIFSAVVLIAGSLFILSQTIPRLINPQPVDAEGIILIAIIGVIVNGVGYFRLQKGISQNEKVLSWHLLEDILGWIVLLIGAIIIRFWDQPVIDPLMTIGFTVFVLWSVSKNARETFTIFLQGVPETINVDEVKESILLVEGVKKVHDIHIWSLEGETNIFTAHIVVKEGYQQSSDKIKRSIKSQLEKYNIKHSTLELESEVFCSETECIFDKAPL